MQAIKSKSSANSTPLSEVFDQSKVRHFSALMLAAEQTPNNDTGYTDLLADVKAGTPNALCAEQCLHMPWYKSGCQSAAPCEATLVSQLPGLMSTKEGRHIMQ